MLHVIESLGVGGAEQALVNLLPVLAEGGASHEVLALGPPFTLREGLRRVGIRVHTAAGASYGRLPLSTLTLARLVRSRRVDLLHAHLFASELACAAVGALSQRPRVAVTFHNVGYDFWPPSGAKGRLRLSLHRLVASRAVDGFSAVSQAAAESYQRHLRLPRVDVLGLPVPALDRSPSRAPREAVLGALGIDPKRPVVVFVGRLVAGKGHEVALESFSRVARDLPDALLVMIGSGPREPAIAREIEARGLATSARLLPAMPNERLLAVLGAVDLLILPSFSEALPVVLVEAMASSLPIVATRVGGIPEVIEGGAGVLVDPGDAGGLAAEITALLRDGERRAAIGARGLELARARFSSDAVAARWRSFEGRVVDGR